MKHFFKSLFGTILLIILAIIMFLGISGYTRYKTAITKTPISEKVEEIQSAINYSEIDEIPKTFKNAMVAVEDRRFYTHKGIDVIGTLRAVSTDIKHREFLEGGSTITQQLAKNLYFPGDNSPIRKVAEMIMAVNLEKEYSKDEILELYFNVIYFGKGCYNVGTAANIYFGVDVSEMTRYQSTLLAGIPNAPSIYSNDAELARKRQEKVLDSMIKEKYISKEDKQEILSEE